MPLATLFSNMIISKGRSGTFFWCTFSLGLVQIITMLLIWQWGIRSMVIAYMLINTSWLLVWLFFVRRLTGYGYWRFFCDVMPFALASAGVMAASYAATLSLSNLWALLISRFVIAATLYYIVMKVARVKILKECERFVFKRK